MSSTPGPTNLTHGTGLAYKFPAKLLLINLSRHGLDHLGHNRSLPPSTLGVSGQ